MLPISDGLFFFDIDRLFLSGIGGKAIFESEIVLDLAERDLRLPVATSRQLPFAFNG